VREILEQCSALGIELDRETMEAAEHATLLDELLARSMSFLVAGANWLPEL
jgi:hypothetical protein